MTVVRPNRKIKNAASQPKRQPGRAKGPRAKNVTKRGLHRIGRALWPERFPEPGRAVAEPNEQMPSRMAKGFLVVWTLAVALAAGSFVLHLHVRFEVIRTGYALSSAQSEQRQLRLGQRELRLELATLKAPARIEQQARDELGMARPEHDRIVRIGKRQRIPRLALRRD